MEQDTVITMTVSQHLTHAPGYDRRHLMAGRASRRGGTARPPRADLMREL